MLLLQKRYLYHNNHKPMPVKVAQREKDTIYFCTFTCLHWLSLFDRTQLYDRIYDAFDRLKKEESPILGYVIMPNHLHFLLYLSRKSPVINQVIGRMKRFLAYDIVERLREANENDLLWQLAEAVPWYEQKRGKKHECFESSFDWKHCQSEEFILQKLQYMHGNPVSSKWNLVDDFVDYSHSSAYFYEMGKQGVYEVTHYKEVYG